MSSREKHSIQTFNFSLSLIVSYSLFSAFAYAGPVGGEVVGGVGTISQGGVQTTVHQTSQTMAINWQSYNVAVDERVQYVQPNASALSLNRILSTNGSTIAGRIDANGQVILVNPNGVFFTPTAVVNVGGIIASGLDIQPNDFMNGRYIFDEVLGGSGAVVNAGLINASLGGNVALLGRQVENRGVIAAQLGTVSLASGKQAVLTFDNGGVLGVRVSREILQDELGVDAAVVNSGEITASGGRVLLTASTSQEVFSQAVNTQGIDQARSVVVHADGSFTLGGGADVVQRGRIEVSGEQGGRVVVLGENVTSSGTMRAEGHQGRGGEVEVHARAMALLTQDSVTSVSATSGDGGTVKVLGDKVGVLDRARIDASGAQGGGQVLVGGGFQGRNAGLRNASATVVAPEATINADAIDAGDGGTVVVWADGTTRYYGRISTRGGAQSGDGGLVEVSGKQFLVFDGLADRTAPHGQAGTLLLDPRDITIVSGNSNPNTDNNNQISPSPFDGNVLFADGGANTDYDITADRLVLVLAAGPVSLQANRDITVNTDVTANVGNANALTLEAGNDILIDANINLRNGNLTLISGSTACGGACQTSSTPDLTISGTIDTTGVVSLTSGRDLGVDEAIGNTVRPSSLMLTAVRNIVVSGDITTNGNVTATSTNGYFDNWFNNQNLNAGSGNITIMTTGFGTVAKNINFTEGAFLGDITTTGTLSVTTTAGGIRQSIDPTRNLDVAGAATFNSGANEINLLNSVNNMRGPINITTAGINNASVANAATTTTLGTVVVGGALNVTATQNLTLAGNITTTGATTLNFATGSSSTFTAPSGVNFAASSLTINGGGNADTFNIGTNIPGALNGNDGGDNFNITNTGISIAGLYGGNSSGLDTGTSDTLTGNNQTNVWQVSGSNVGTLNTTINFFGIENLTGNAAADNFTIGASGSITGTIDGAGAANILTGRDAANTWTITSATDGSLGLTAGAGAYVGTFRNIQTLQGGTGTDIFQLHDTANFAGSINGGGVVLVGAPGDEVRGGNRATTWTITAVGNTGTVTGLATGNTFTNVTVLTGNSGADSFQLHDSIDFAGSINGGGGANELRGGNRVNTWTVTAANTGTVTGVTGSTFSNIQALTGNALADNFTFNGGASLTGLLHGGGSTSDTLNITALGATTVNIRDSAAAVTNPANTLSIFEIEAVTANNNNATLRGADIANTWTIGPVFNFVNGQLSNGTNDGTVGALTFVGFPNLTGGTNTDNFIFTNNGRITGTTNGSTGTNTLTGRNADSNWTISGLHQGTVSTAGVSGTQYASFINIQSLIGGTADDTFSFNVTPGTANVAINGGSQVTQDTVDFSGLAGQVVIVQLGNTGFSNIERYIGNNTNSTLIGENIVNIWAINSANAGTVNNTTNFEQFNILTGGTMADTFNVNANASVDTINGGNGNDTVIVRATAVVGTINGGANDDRFEVLAGGSVNTINGDAGNDTFLLDGAVTSASGGDGIDSIVYSEPNKVVNVGSTASGFEGVEALNGGILNGRNLPTSWTVSGVNSGAVSDSGGENLTFRGFQTLNGGNNADTFNVSGLGHITGAINANSGDDLLNVTLSGTQVGTLVFNGGAHNTSDRIVISGNAGAGTYDGSYLGNFLGATLTQVRYTSSSGASYGVNFSNVESIQDTVQANSMAVVGGINNDNFVLARNLVLGMDTITMNNSVPLAYGNKNNITIFGGFGTDTVTIQSSVNLPNTGTLLLSVETVTAMSGTSINAGELHLSFVANPVGAANDRLQTNISRLSVNGSTTVYINEQNALELNQISTSGLIDVVAAGSITTNDVFSRSSTAASVINLTSSNGDIALTGQNTFAGALTFTAENSVRLNNTGPTNLAGVASRNLEVTSTGDITDSGLITVANNGTGVTRLASGGNITLDGANNDFEVLDVTGANVLFINDVNNIVSGNITANSVGLRATTGIGSLNTPVNTQTAILDVINTNAAIVGNVARPMVNISNTGAVEVRNLQNRGDVLLTYNGNVTLHPLSITANHGGVIADSPYAGNVTLSVLQNGGTGSIFGFGADFTSNPDIIAQNLTVTTNNAFGVPSRPISIRVNDVFTLFAATGSVYYFGAPPLQIVTPSSLSLFVFNAFAGFNGQQLIEIESLADVDPAIFTAVRNYFYEDVAIRMPPDQTYTEDDDKEKKRNLEGVVQ